ncbi:GNAT family N-acetyltransferase [Paenibacillus sinopodophylli]|uniref:GNAT family N-acetyltransferase n=1 Tax=Paenibacillus sinopodophylli TaxID=1837342 RepID=UPI001485E46D|nr:GNAT family N-acetyltransferase [Paenibacillus sinopodophylli]
MEIAFKDISKSNWEECIQLKLHDEQVQYVAPNWYSIIEASFDNSYVPKAVYLDSHMIGFFMFGKDPSDQSYWIVRLMIDKHYQGNGLGRATLLKGIELIRNKPDCSSEIITSFKPDNKAAGSLYEQVGFKKTGHIIDGEVVVRLRVK